MKCPKCENELLQATKVRGVEVDRCPECHGVWFDERELPRLLDEAPSDLRPIRGGKVVDDVNRQKANCPRDGSQLTRVRSAVNEHIILDSCSTCRGVWCDGGELDQLLQN